jgi:hypothetical protein
MLLTMVMFKETGEAQVPADVGVNIYVVVPGAEVFIVDGLHVPVMPSSEVAGSGGDTAFWQ